MGWEHVSVSLPHRTPHWRERCFIKDVFWDRADVMMQYHPKKSEYVNRHEHGPHLWRPRVQENPTPPKACVGEGSLRRGWRSNGVARRRRSPYPLGKRREP
jgi:hypothetical protein